MSSSLWIHVVSYIESRISAESYQTWFAPLKCVQETEQKLVVGMPNRFYADWILSNYKALINEALACANASGVELSWKPLKPSKSASLDHNQEQNQAQLSFLPTQTPASALPQELAIQTHENKTSALPVASRAPLLATPRTRKAATPTLSFGNAQTPLNNKSDNGSTNESTKLNPKYHFDDFVVGTSNELAYAACSAAASSPGRRYNPIFLYGGVGLGKTHLINAVGHHILQDNPSARVLYVSAEQFTNEFISGLQNHKIHEFRKRYRQDCDVLLMDDIQFLAGRVQTQEEFFHTFNALYHADRQIVDSSDVSPAYIGDMQERLISRFQWGLVADVQPPELETRVAILRKKAAVEKLVLSDDVASYIAEHGGANVRELEGLLLRVAARAELLARPIDLELVKTALGAVASTRQSVVGVEDVQKTVCSYFNVRMADLKSHRRHRAHAVPRMIAMYLCRKKLGLSYPELGERFGGKDHTTVLSAVKRIETLIDQDDRVRLAIDHLQKKLGAA